MGFNPVLLSCEIGAEKPEKKAFEILLHRLNAPAKDCLLIDDYPENIETAKALGMSAILFHSVEQLQLDLKSILQH